MKALAIDFGEKRVGLAISDLDGRYAMPLRTLERRSDVQVIQDLASLIEEESVELIVIGEPRNLNGSVGDQAKRVESFSRKLEKTVGVPIETVNESLTSREADARLRRAGYGPAQRRARVDAVAAQILLQEVLDRRAEAGA
ncbi:MAG: Holliday junction resolvase RuvX [Thermoanaerobaculia bacterium]